MGDGECRHSGDWGGDLWSWYHQVELGQLCRIMKDVPSGEGLCYMLHVVLKGEVMMAPVVFILGVSVQLTLTLTSWD